MCTRIIRYTCEHLVEMSIYNMYKYKPYIGRPRFQFTPTITRAQVKERV